MGDAEKIMEMKKAYADIILNTSKEAAARIMAVEKKAFRFQSELSFVKEEALQTLLRVKQMMDSKVHELEKRSLSQQRKIEELEAQLQEAEDIVEDLREELTTVRGELKCLKNSQSLAEDNLRHCAAIQEEMSEVKQLDASGAIICPLPDWQLQPLRALAGLSLKLHEATHDEPSTYLAMHLKTDGSKIQHTTDCQVDNQYVCNPDLTSMIMRSQEPEPSRNKCTLRVQAFERSMLDGNFSLTTQVDSVTKESIVSKGKKIEDMHASCTLKADISCPLEMTPIQSKELVSPIYTNSSGTYRPKSFRRKKKRAVRCRKPQSSLHTQVSNFSWPQIFPLPVERSVQHGENTSNASENKARNHLESSFPSSDLSEMKTQFGSGEIYDGYVDTVKFFGKQDTLNQDSPITDIGLTLQYGTAKSFRTSASKVDLDINNLPSKSEKVSSSDGMNYEVACRPVNDRIRYTFQRKRKKESLGNPSGSASLEKSSLEKERTENDPEAPQISIIRKASRDRRRVAQVAHQLISLSEKKCWY